MRHLIIAAVVVALLTSTAAAAPVWQSYGGNPQHTAISTVASQPLSSIRWQTPVDLSPQYTAGEYLLIHYGSPLVTQANTVILPVKTGATNGFKIEARSGANGSLIWSQSTNYTVPQPASSWIPSYAPSLTPSNRLYFAGAGGLINYRDNPDFDSDIPVGQVAFYGLANYNANPAAFDANVFINTPITSDAAGNIYFGYQVNNSSAAVLNLHGGIARIDPAGNSTFIEANTLVPGMTKSAMNAAPALSNDGSKLYAVLNTGSSGRLVELNSSDLSLVGSSGPLAAVLDIATASPTVGPDGDVYFGTANGYNSRGILNHFSADLSQVKTPASFGWDDTASIVPASLVPSYSGTSSYLLMIKYNNYAPQGDGSNEVAIVDPNDLTQFDAILGQNVMREILTKAGVTPDEDFPGFPNAVREWCINTAVVDPATHSVLVNNEDGRLYRWDLFTNTLSEAITLTEGIGEAYTPTLIGADGKVYAINNATLFAVGVPEPSTLVLAVLAGTLGILMRYRRRR
jgi:hypothetical protein